MRVKRTRHPFSMRAKPRAAAKWLLPPPGGPNKNWRTQPAVARGKRGDLRLGDPRHGLEVKVVEGLS